MNKYAEKKTNIQIANRCEIESDTENNREW